MRDDAKLPTKLSPDGLLIGYSLEADKHRPVMGFQFGEAIEDEDGAGTLIDDCCAACGCCLSRGCS